MRYHCQQHNCSFATLETCETRKLQVEGIKIQAWTQYRSCADCRGPVDEVTGKVGKILVEKKRRWSTHGENKRNARRGQDQYYAMKHIYEEARK